MGRQNVKADVADVEKGDEENVKDSSALLDSSQSKSSEEPVASSKQVVFWLLFWMAK